ncbi:MAG: hypothetical protein BAA04_13520 [Firmicutes bacterium ZCTH02-B6]|nr:MAG: hypothetical protein BAA04_13520 [Firmicutes bacterium ZCTH02-B6]
MAATSAVPNDDSLLIRLASLDDAPAIARISQEAYAEFAGRVEPPFRALTTTAAQVRHEMRRLRFAYVLAIRDGWPVGHLRCRVRDGSMHVSRLAVLPAYRGQAIGRRLMEWAEQEAHRLGILHLHGEVRSSLHRLLAWYKELGYEPTGTRTLAGVPHFLTIIEKWLDEQPAGARADADPAEEQVWLEETPIAWELLHPALAALPGLRAHSLSRDSR